MIPPIIQRQLSRLRWHERWLRLAWGTALGLTLLLSMLAVFCLTDWIIDRYQETPLLLRNAMYATQVVFWMVVWATVAFWAFFDPVADEALALKIEEKTPELGQRLISALQLNRPGAKTQGMSPALIGVLTQEAEEHAGKLDISRVTDHHRLERAGWLVLGILLVAGVLLVMGPDTVVALVARQFLSDRDIPRSVALESISPAVWPAGEDLVMRFRVHGRDLHANLQGEVRIDPDHASSEHYPLVFEMAGLTPREAMFIAPIKPTTANFTYMAWLRDGRTRRPLTVEMVPRPAIVQQDAWIQLPEYSGKRPNGQPYEMLQPRGDIIGTAGAKARVLIKTQKPIKKAVLELLEAQATETDPANPDGDGEMKPAPAAVKDKVVRSLPMTIDANGDRAQALFDLKAGEGSYRIRVWDQYEFANLDPPRRSIRLVPEEPPVVALLPERFGEPGRASSEDDEVEGIPILFKGKFRVAFTCSSPYGLGKAVLRYRVNEMGDWLPLPLREIRSTDQTGPFDPKQGVFVNSGFFDEVEFHRMPSTNPDQIPFGTDGGGRFDFRTAGLNDLKIGDKVEFYVEVYDRNPAEGREPGRSEIRQKIVVTLDEYMAWKDQVQQQESRIRQLENRQRSVFTASNTKEPDNTTTKKPPVGPETPPPATAFVRSWQIIGPFPNPDLNGHNIVFPPEKDKTDITKSYPGLKGDIRWKLHHSQTDKIDLEKYLNHSEAGVAYALCWVRSAEDAKAILSTGSDDGIKVWIDRREVLAKKAVREAVPGEDKTPVELKEEDWHELLIKIDNKTGTWAFYLEFLDPETGKPLEGLRFRALPPGEEDKQFVRSWQLIGPFPNIGDNGREQAYPPETDKVDLEKEYNGIPGKVRWKMHTSETGRIGLDRFFERPFNESNLAYAVCWVRCDKDRPAVLATGSDDGIKVWINRRLKIDAAVSREAAPGKDIQKIDLKQGWNEILVKVDNRFGRWAFYLELRDPETERPLEGIEFAVRPPKEE